MHLCCTSKLKHHTAVYQKYHTKCHSVENKLRHYKSIKSCNTTDMLTIWTSWDKKRCITSKSETDEMGRTTSTRTSNLEFVRVSTKYWALRMTHLYASVTKHIIWYCLRMVMLFRWAVTVGLAEWNGCRPPGSWLTSPVNWLSNTEMSPHTLQLMYKYTINFAADWLETESSLRPNTYGTSFIFYPQQC